MNTESLPPYFDEVEHTTSTSAAVGFQTRDRAVLIQLSGQDAGKLHRLRGEVSLIGRGRGCGVFFEDASLSRVHARIVRMGRDYVLEDAGSTNGTCVNDERVTEIVLGDGDRLSFGGSASLLFQLVSADEERALVKSYESSVRDGLTGLFNRKYLDSRLLAEVSYAVRHGSELSLVLVDLDGFKRVNDTRGHLCGDAVLRGTASTLAGMVRTEVVVARFGGEEIVVVARGVSVENAALFANRMRRGVEAARVPFGADSVQVTASFGVASLACCPGERTAAGLLAIADERLYCAKKMGRNRVVGR
jgi:diguanylate cyclase (GGDEF)-like protein